MEDDRSLQAALVRKLLFETPKAGDEQTIESAFRARFAKQNPDGSLEDEHDQGILAATGGELVRLLEMGCSPQRPEMVRAFCAVDRAIAHFDDDRQDEISCYSLRALCAVGATDSPAVAASLQHLASDMTSMLGAGCPWTPEVQLNALWAGRGVCAVDAAIRKGLRWIDDAFEPPGASAALGLCMPWSMVQMVGVIDDPMSAEIAGKLVPMLLRRQQPDGGWGDDEGMSSFWTFAALKKHGLLDKLRGRPPLPADWRVVRSIPSPAGKGFPVIAADAGNLWVHSPQDSTAVLVSSEDGRVLRATGLARNGPFGAWDGSLWVLEEQTIYRLHSESGEITEQVPLEFDPHPFRCMVRVGDRILIPDSWEGGVWAIDPTASEEPRSIRLAAGMPDFVASDGNTIWTLDNWAGALIHTDMEGRLRDWGERPFGFAGIAWNGESLWALDNESRQICMIEKNVS